MASPALLQLVFLICVICTLITVGLVVWMVWKWRRISIPNRFVEIGTALAAASVPFFFFFTSDPWVQTGLRQILASLV